MDGVVQPAKNALVQDAPVCVAALRLGRRGGQVIGEPKFANEGIKELTPLGIVGFGELEDDGNVGFYVDCLEDGSGGSGDDRGGAGKGGIRGRGGYRGMLAVREVAVEQWVDVHGSG